MSADTTTHLSPHLRRQIATKALVEPKTVDKCYRGKPVRETTALRVVAAAQELGIPLPTNVNIAR